MWTRRGSPLPRPTQPEPESTHTLSSRERSAISPPPASRETAFCPPSRPLASSLETARAARGPCSCRSGRCRTRWWLSEAGARRRRRETGRREPRPRPTREPARGVDTLSQKISSSLTSLPAGKLCVNGQWLFVWPSSPAMTCCLFFGGVP